MLNIVVQCVCPNGNIVNYHSKVSHPIYFIYFNFIFSNILIESILLKNAFIYCEKICIPSDLAIVVKCEGVISKHDIVPVQVNSVINLLLITLLILTFRFNILVFSKLWTSSLNSTSCNTCNSC